ncbi:RraA family protein [Bacillus sp. Marseille-Q3570]|uniref:RraA family protein n=1 Tax=Bacillus sp. Marseille-Q3570 TaxID=2963522 RepID=UPI0021B73D83|nr:RraA family protein [Bacillus sp. Marseille-Q3570]
MSNIGFRVLPRTKKVDQSIIEGFKNAVTPHVSDNLNRMFAAGTTLRPYHNSGKLVGTAITVKTRPGDNLMVHKAIDIAEPGDVLVVDAGGDTTNAIVGEIMLKIAKKKGITGFIIDGAIRDSGAFKNGEFPVYAKGVTHRGPYKDGPGEINVPITLGEMIVQPGDLLLGDEDGLVVIPQESAEEILGKVKAQERKELDIFKTIEDDSIDRGWINETLKQKGCEF